VGDPCRFVFSGVGEEGWRAPQGFTLFGNLAVKKQTTSFFENLGFFSRAVYRQ